MKIVGHESLDGSIKHDPRICIDRKEDRYLNDIPTRRAFVAAMAVACLLLKYPGQLLAAPQSTALPANIAEGVETLKAGEFFWAPTIAPAGPMLAVISLSSQRCYVYRNGLLIGISTISTGKAGHQTPTGIFTILQKQVHHKSNLYDSAPMPFMERLTWKGVAMHAGHLPGYPASHGCVRMPLAFAELLYGTTAEGMTVVITNLQAVPRIAPTPDLLQSNIATAASDLGPATWRPENATSGPVSLILSGADKRLVVLRNGKMIGSTPVTITGAVIATTAYSLSQVDAQGPHWMELPLPGDAWEGALELPASERARVHVPDAFRSALDGVLVPGATLVVTPDSLLASATGTSVTVLSSQTVHK